MGVGRAGRAGCAAVLARGHRRARRSGRDGAAGRSGADLSGRGGGRAAAGDLGSLEEPAVLVIDDLHELRSVDALAWLDRFLARLPAMLRVVLATRETPQLALHRRRLAGELTELRGADLRFSREETKELLAATGIKLSDDALAGLYERTEGWAAGLRLAAISVAGSVVDRVCGPLADHLTGRSGSEALLQELEEANAVVTSLDVGRTWFRYHPLRRPAAARAPANLARDGRRAAPRGRPVARAGGLRGRGDPARAGGARLSVGIAPAGRRPPRPDPRRAHGRGA
jgi:hypothetical protein